jgi:F-type H+-transporting ATPase subunit b
MGFNLTTFLFEIVNFIVLVWLLQRVLYKPLQRAIAKRNDVIKEREQAAELRMQQAEHSLADYRERQAELDGLRAQTIRDATEQASEERARILEQAREDAAAEHVRAQRMLDAEREAALAWVREVLVERGAEVAGRILARLAPEALEPALLDELLSELDRQSDLLRREAGPDEADGGAAREVEVTFAKMPGDEGVSRLRDKLGETLGLTPRLALREDETLGAGLVLRVGNRVLDASMAGQLEAFRDSVREIVEAEV